MLYNLNSTAELDTLDRTERRTLKTLNTRPMGFLQFIIDNYFDLPESMVFVHGSQCVSSRWVSVYSGMRGGRTDAGEKERNCVVV